MKKLLLLLCFIAFAVNADAQRRGRNKKTPVKKVAVLTRHPDDISLKGGDDTTNYYFFVTDAGLFFTEKKDVRDEICDYLPSRHIPGRTVELEGTTLTPFTKFSRRQLSYLSRRAGKALNKHTKAIRISGHSLKSSEDRKTTSTYKPPGQ